MKRHIYIIFTIIITACSNAQDGKKNDNSSNDSLNIKTDTVNHISITRTDLDSTLCGLNFNVGKNYKLEKTEIIKIRNSLIHQYRNASDTISKNRILDSSMVVFTNLLLNNIIPYWYETKWDFNGYTSIPNQGTIACGYFVSTTLKDMGLNLNRYKLAQKGPENEAKSIAIMPSATFHYKEEELNDTLSNFNDGLYFVGLDNHVGFLYLNNGSTYFLHSNYIDGKVMIENIEYSEAFPSSNYYISKISGNRFLAEKWLKKEEIIVIKT